MMKAESASKRADTVQQVRTEYLSSAGDPIEGSAQRLLSGKGDLRDLLIRLEKLVVPDHLAPLYSLRERLDALRTKVSMVGQVKAGKTILTSALIGRPGLLPSDVNPWTSAITSIHINTRKPRGANAVFSFYTDEDWRNLTEGGGQFGELARRADFESELTNMRRQVAEMQRRTEDRLGSHFNLLLGSQHTFSDFNTKLLERYVCLGDADASRQLEGRYADVTKSADLYMDSDSFALPMTIADTPGVNDPFLARERATLNALSDSNICVIVLSAHQALASVDLALVNILLAFNPGRLVLFVNRIDELQNPDIQIPEIDRFVRGILSEKGIDPELPIVYGSAVWSELAQPGVEVSLPDDGLQRLQEFGLARSRRAAMTANAGGQQLLGLPPYSLSKTRDLSGIFELKALIDGLSIRSVAAPVVVELMLKAADLAQQSTLVMANALESDSLLRKGVDVLNVVNQLDSKFADIDSRFATVRQSIIDEVNLSVSAAFNDFIQRETALLRNIVKEGRRIADWTPDTESLRRDLNRAYSDLMTGGTTEISALYTHAAEAIDDVYKQVLRKDSQLFAVRPPAVMDPVIPASLMRTMTLDMKSSWVGNWLARMTGANAMATRFSEVAIAEMTVFLDEMRDVHVVEFVTRSRQILNDFLADHLGTLHSIAVSGGPKRGQTSQQQPGIEAELKQRLVALRTVLSELQSHIASMCEDFGLAVK